MGETTDSGASAANEIHLFVKAGDSCYNAHDLNAARSNYLSAARIIESSGRKTGIHADTIARTYFMLGDCYYEEFEEIELTVSSEEEIKPLIKLKSRALQKAIKFYLKAVVPGAPQWRVKATYEAGMGLIDLANAVENQPLFGNPTQKIAGEIRVLSSLDKYFEKAQEHFTENIEWAHAHNYKDEFIEESIYSLSEILYRRGYIMERVRMEFYKALLRNENSIENWNSRILYEEMLHERINDAKNAALSKYEEALKTAQRLKLGQNEWLSKIRERTAEINPASEALQIEIEEWFPEASKSGLMPKGR